MTRAHVTTDDCRGCGACCLGGLDDGAGWADCTAEDMTRMSSRVQTQLIQINLGFSELRAATPVVMTEEFGSVCSFLRGTPGQRVSCRIYASRPDVCREYAPGSNGCLAARTEIGLDIS